MIVLVISGLTLTLGVILGLNGLPLQGFIVCVCGGLLPFVYEPIKSLFRK